jgi:hypothetical protein
MTNLDCSCGYEADTPEDLRDHLGEVFIPLGDDIGTDGRVHAEPARDGNSRDPAALGCLCGFTAGDKAAMDEHLLRMFTPADGVGPDGTRHVPRQAA